MNYNPTIRVAFENSGCVPFCEKIQEVGHHMQLGSMFSLNLKEGKVKLGNLELFISEKLIVDATTIPANGETWREMI